MASKQKQNTKKIRYDHNGVEINSKNKRKVKLTFIDKISSQPLIEIVDVDNYKEFNKIAMAATREDAYIRNTPCCSCIIY